MARVITGTKAQIETGLARLHALLRLPLDGTPVGDGIHAPPEDSRTTRWGEPELLDDGVTWALRVPVKGVLRHLRERVQAEGVDAVLAGTGVTKAQAAALLDAIRDAVERRTKREADSETETDGAAALRTR